jgi:hypothetical protein
MRVVLIIILIAMAPVSAARAQSDREAVLKTIGLFFDTMTARDVEGQRRVLVPQARFFAMDMRQPNLDPQSLTTEDALARLGKTKYISHERIWNPEVRVHGVIATVWAPYDLWVDGKFNHCGVDAFDLIKTADGWKLSGGAFTIEANCEPSPLGPLKR